MPTRRLLGVSAALVFAACGDDKPTLLPDAGDVPTAPQCSDRRDNDGDGKADYPLDPGCISPNQDDETDDCPSGPNCPQCSNGVDDDMNGSSDFPMDATGCTSAADTEELVNDPIACGAALTIKSLPIDGTDTGTFVATSTSTIGTTCGGGGGAQAIAYAVNVPRESVLVISTDNLGTTADTVLDFRSADCDDAAAEIACNDNVDDDPDISASTLTVPVAAGRYYIIVQGYDALVTGDYDLSVDIYAGEGSTCTMTMDCGPGLVCRTPLGGTAMVCAQSVCNDGLDDDGDLRTDYPADPGCASATDDTETDDCPSGPNCPACSNGVDDDGDTFTDYPLDTACTAAGSTTESCTGEVDPIRAITTGTTTGTTIGASNDHAACIAVNTGADVLFTLALPAVTSLTIDTELSTADTVLSLLDATCAAPSLACDDDGSPLLGGESLVELGPLAAGHYVVAVDAYSDDADDNGPFTIHVSGVLPSGASCEPANTLDGALTCPVTFPCSGAAGSRTCRPPACNNTLDDDGDGRVDFPNEPGCTHANDTDETDACPGAGCPACANGIDDDGDNATDYPGDLNCTSAAAVSEQVCGELDPIGAITTATTTGTLVGASNDHVYTTCGSPTNMGVERTYTIALPALTSFTADTSGTGTDIVLELLPMSCVGPLACDDEGGDPTGAARVTVGPLTAGSYLLVVNASDATTTLGAYDLHVSGVLPVGASCEPTATFGGAFTCPAVAPCQGPAGARACTPTQCNNAVDDDGDGDGDGFPSDPGCASLTDNDESDDCPSGPNCPQCSNDLDDDMDGMFDYPADTTCSSAAGTSELSPPCGETDAVLAITGPSTVGTLVGATDNRDYPNACTTFVSTAGSGPERTYTLALPAAVSSLTLDTSVGPAASTTDVIVSLLGSTCAEPNLGCDDEEGDSIGAALFTTGPLSAGNYLVSVDAWSPDTPLTDGYTLALSGVLAVGASCEPTATVGGALVCPLANPCSGTAGSRVCQ